MTDDVSGIGSDKRLSYTDSTRSYSSRSAKRPQYLKSFVYLPMTNFIIFLILLFPFTLLFFSLSFFYILSFIPVFVADTFLSFVRSNFSVLLQSFLSFFVSFSSLIYFALK